MAHSCPECGSMCYCNGDIDDCLLDFEDDVNGCVCCVGRDDVDEDDSDSSEWTCPGCGRPADEECAEDCIYAAG